MIDFFRQLFDYDNWANRLTIASLTNQHSERSISVLAHIVTTKQEYFDRFNGKDSTGFDFWPNLDLDECAALAASTHQSFTGLLDQFDDDSLDRIVQYKTSGGLPFENTYRELFTHVLLHASIHRGNIVLKMREEGFEPPKIDYILYLRR